jgi:transporter family protein
MPIVAGWLPWALLSAVFAALTAIFAKIGLEGIDSDYATLLRTVVIVLTLGALVYATGKWRSPWEIPVRSGGFLVLSAFATGASWICYFRALKLGEASRVAPVDKLSVVLVAVFAVLFLGERPDGREWVGIALVAAGVLLLSLRLAPPRRARLAPSPGSAPVKLPVRPVAGGEGSHAPPLPASVAALLLPVPRRSSASRAPSPNGGYPHDVAVGADGIAWYTAQRVGALGRLIPQPARWTVQWGRGAAPHGVIIGPDGAPWDTEAGLWTVSGTTRRPAR